MQFIFKKAYKCSCFGAAFQSISPGISHNETLQKGFRQNCLTVTPLMLLDLCDIGPYSWLDGGVGNKKIVQELRVLDNYSRSQIEKQLVSGTNMTSCKQSNCTLLVILRELCGHCVPVSQLEFSVLQWKNEQWKFLHDNQVLLFSKNTGKALEILKDGKVDGTADDHDAEGRLSETFPQ